MTDVLDSFLAPMPQQPAPSDDTLGDFFAPAPRAQTPLPTLSHKDQFEGYTSRKIQDAMSGRYFGKEEYPGLGDDTDTGLKAQAKVHANDYEAGLRKLMPDMPDETVQKVRDTFEEQVAGHLRGKELLSRIDRSNRNPEDREIQRAYERIPFLRSGQQLGSSIDIYKAASAIKDGKGTTADYDTVGQYLSNQQQDQKRPTLAKISDFASQMPAEIAEWMIPSGLVGKAGIGAAEGAGKLGANATGKVVAKYAAMALARTALRPDKLAAETLSEMTPQVGFDADGNMATKEGGGFGKSLQHAAVRETIQNAALEASGGMNIPKVGFTPGNVALSAGKMLFANQLSAEGATYLGGGGTGGYTTRYATAKDDKERKQVLMDFVAEAVPIVGLEAALHGLGSIREEAKSKGMNVGGEPAGEQPGGPGEAPKGPSAGWTGPFKEAADSATLKDTYRQAAKELHPDRNPGNPDAAEAFIKIKKAYDNGDLAGINDIVNEFRKKYPPQQEQPQPQGPPKQPQGGTQTTPEPIRTPEPPTKPPEPTAEQSEPPPGPTTERRGKNRPPQGTWEAIVSEHPEWNTEQIGREAARRADAANVDTQTGLGSRHKFGEDAKAHGSHTTIYDIPSMHEVNNHFGDNAGDALLAAHGAAMREAGIERGYRKGGDELAALFDSPEEQQSQSQKYHDILQNTLVEWEDANGNKVSAKGFGAAIAHGSTPTEAGARLPAAKEAASAKGLRSRGPGKLPPGLAITPAPGGRTPGPEVVGQGQTVVHPPIGPQVQRPGPAQTPIPPLSDFQRSQRMGMRHHEMSEAARAQETARNPVRAPLAQRTRAAMIARSQGLRAPVQPIVQPGPAPREPQRTEAGLRPITESNIRELLDRVDGNKEGLTDDERLVLQHRLIHGLSFRRMEDDIKQSKDTVAKLEAKKKAGKLYPYEESRLLEARAVADAFPEKVTYATLNNREKAGLRKLGHSGTVDQLHKANRGSQVSAQVDADVAGQDVHGDIDRDTAGVLHRKLTKEEHHVAAISDLVDQYLKEKNRGTITPEREADYIKRISELERAFAREASGEHQQPEGSEGETAAGPTPGKTPVRRVGTPAGEQPREVGTSPQDAARTAKGLAENAPAAPQRGKADRDKLKWRERNISILMEHGSTRESAEAAVAKEEKTLITHPDWLHDAMTGFGKFLSEKYYQGHPEKRSLSAEEIAEQKRDVLSHFIEQVNAVRAAKGMVPLDDPNGTKQAVPRDKLTPEQRKEQSIKNLAKVRARRAQTFRGWVKATFGGIAPESAKALGRDVKYDKENYGGMYAKRGQGTNADEIAQYINNRLGFDADDSKAWVADDVFEAMTDPKKLHPFASGSDADFAAQEKAHYEAAQQALKLTPGEARFSTDVARLDRVPPATLQEDVAGIKAAVAEQVESEQAGDAAEDDFGHIGAFDPSEFGAEPPAQGMIPRKGKGRGAAINMADAQAAWGKARQAIAKGMDDVKRIIAPAARGPHARTAAGVLRYNLAEMQRSKTVAIETLQKAERYFDKIITFAPTPQLRQERFLKITDAIEGERPMASLKSDVRVFAELIRGLLDQRTQQVKDRDLVTDFIEDYFGHLWKKPGMSPDDIGKMFGRRPLAGGEGFRKKRTIPTYREGIEDHGLEPISWNPATLALQLFDQIDKSVMKHDVMKELAAKGLRKFGRHRSPQPGWVQGKDRSDVVHAPPMPGGAGPQRVGHYYYPHEVATLIDNYLQPGLRGNMVYDVARAFGNNMVQFQQGLSAFHVMFEMIDNLSSGISEAVQQLSRGELLKAGTTFLKFVGPTGGGAVVGGMVGGPVGAGVGGAAGLTWSTLQALWHGNKVLAEYYKPGSQGAEMAAVIHAALQGGYAASMDPTRDNESIKKFRRALTGIRQGFGSQIPAAIYHGLGAINELLSWPVMRSFVPRMKAAVMMRMINDIMAAHPGRSPLELRAEIGKAIDAVDDRMGQMRYDNLFWNKTLKDMLMVMVRSVGWNFGSTRALGGGVGDIPSSIRGTLKGEGVSPRLAYIVGMAMATGLVGAILQYFFTGKGPEEPKDLFAPKTGGKNPDGTDKRVVAPTYMRDVAALTNRADEGPTRIGKNLAEMAGHKKNPAISTLAELISGEDFSGKALYDPRDTTAQKVDALARHLLQSIKPFSLRGGDTTKEGIAQMFGITPANRSVSRTWAQQQADEESRKVFMTPLEKLHRERQLEDEATFADKAFPKDPKAATDLADYEKQYRLMKADRSKARANGLVYDKERDFQQLHQYQSGFQDEVHKFEGKSKKNGVLAQGDTPSDEVKLAAMKEMVRKARLALGR